MYFVKKKIIKLNFHSTYLTPSLAKTSIRFAAGINRLTRTSDPFLLGTIFLAVGFLLVATFLTVGFFLIATFLFFFTKAGFFLMLFLVRRTGIFFLGFGAGFLFLTGVLRFTAGFLFVAGVFLVVVILRGIFIVVIFFV